MDHFYKVAASRRAAVKIAFFCGARGLFAAWSSRNVATSGRKSFEDGIKVLDDIFFAANHLAVSAVKTPHASTRADVAIVDPFCAKFFGAANVVNVIQIAAVDDDVIFFEP